MLPTFAATVIALLLAVCVAKPVLELPRTKCAPPRYNTTGKIVRGAINIHLQPHSHDDVGWLKTFDEYLVGHNNSIQQAGVSWIYQSVVQALSRNPDRRFASVEMGFLMRWLDMQLPEVVAEVKSLVARDQLHLVNAGWCMHDEATVTTSDALDQMTLGHRLVNATFGSAAAARVAWSIDPFGHSATEASHFTALAGLSAMFYGRLDYQERAWRIANNATEYVWRGSRSLGANAQILAGMNVNGYDPPSLTDSAHPVFEWDVTADNTIRPPSVFGSFQPFPDIDGYNVDEYVSAVLTLAQRHAAYILPDEDGTVNLAWQFGTDFNYLQAELWFTQIDGLIHFVNLNTSTHGVNLLYSSPRDYADAKLAQKTAWPLKDAATPDGLSTDQFPYVTSPHWQWSGYFSSRPALKGYVRTSSQLYTAARQMQAVTGGAPGDGLGPANPLFALERALATAQHHDAVTGTARQHVTYDYAKLLSAGVADAVLLIDAALRSLTGWAPAAPFSLCPLANASLCPALANPTAGDPPTLLLLWNPDSMERSGAAVRVPVGMPAGVASWRVTASNGASPITAQMLPLSVSDAALRVYYGSDSGATTQWLTFVTPPVPPMGYAVVFLQPVASARAAPATHASRVERLAADGADATLTNGVITLTLSAATGLVTQYADAALGAVPLAQGLSYYRSSPGCPLPPAKCDIPNDGTGLNNYGQSSTTYILRPNTSATHALGVAQVEFVSGPVVSEARQSWPGAWASNVLRLVANSSSVESEFTVGPIPVGDGWGKEVVVDWALGGWCAGEPPTLYTDANGQELQKRVLNARSFPGNASIYEPVAYNYFPVTTRAVLVDPPSQRRFTLAVDRAVGCASLAPGALQCMLHRRQLVTTFLGMGEPLNEPGLDASGSGLIVRGAHRFRLDAAGAAAAGSAAAVSESLYPLLPVWAPLEAGATPASWAAAHRAEYSALALALPPQLRVLTAQSLGGGTLLLRLAHTFEAGEDAALSANATVSLGGLFAPPLAVTGVTETTATASLPLADVKQWTLRVQGEADAVTLPRVPAPPMAPSYDVTLAPQEIRTFVLRVE